LQDEVTLDIEEKGPTGHLPFARAGILKHMLRTLHRMMQTSGTSEGLRGLIDTTLIQSIKKIIENRKLFGASVLPIGEPFFFSFVGVWESIDVVFGCSYPCHGDVCA